MRSTPLACIVSVFVSLKTGPALAAGKSEDLRKWQREGPILPCIAGVFVSLKTDSASWLAVAPTASAKTAARLEELLELCLQVAASGFF